MQQVRVFMGEPSSPAGVGSVGTVRSAMTAVYPAAAAERDLVSLLGSEHENRQLSPHPIHFASAAGSLCRSGALGGAPDADALPGPARTAHASPGRSRGRAILLSH